MTAYRVVFHAKADAETIGLPAEAFTALIETLTAVSRDPWTSSAQDDPEGNQAFRWALYGRFGLVHFQIDDDARVVRVHGVTWTG